MLYVLPAPTATCRVRESKGSETVALRARGFAARPTRLSGGAGLSGRPYLPVIVWSCGWVAAVFLCERRSDPPGLELGRLDIGTSLLKGHTLSRHYHSLWKTETRHFEGR